MDEKDFSATKRNGYTILGFHLLTEGRKFSNKFRARLIDLYAECKMKKTVQLLEVSSESATKMLLETKI